jgi:hypothetical protein
VQQERVHHASAYERARKSLARFGIDVVDAMPLQRGKRGRRRNPPFGGRRHLDNLSTCVRESRGAGTVTPSDGDDQRAARDDLGRGRRAELRVENHGARLPPRGWHVADVELGVISEHRANANKDGVVLGPLGVDTTACGLAGDPPTLVRDRATSARRGDLQRHPREISPSTGQEALGDSLRPARHREVVDRDSRCMQPLDTATVTGHRVTQGVNHPGHAGLEQRDAARACPTDVIARLKRHVGSRASGGNTCAPQRHNLGVGATWWLGLTGSHHSSVTHQNAPNGWVGPCTCLTPVAGSERQRVCHMTHVDAG